MKLSKFKHLQCYMTSFDIEFRRFDRQPQSNQLSIIFIASMEVIFETIGTAYIYMNPSHLTIKLIVNRNFGNTFHHHNGFNKSQHTNKHTSQKYQHSNTRQQYQHRKTGQHHHNRHRSQQYQPKSLQRSRTSSIPYLKENYIVCGLNNKYVR